MTAASRAFHGVANRKGVVIGIIPCDDGVPNQPKPSYPNEWVEIPVYTHLSLSGARGTEPMSRNHINVLTAQVLIALPGGLGTASEVRLALQYEKPIVAHLHDASEIVGLPEGTPIESDFARVQAFVRARLGLDV
jgi:predicted Rossmann-fold nucleotide-binding protein